VHAHFHEVARKDRNYLRLLSSVHKLKANAPYRSIRYMRRTDGMRVENDGISLSYPEDSTGPTSLDPHLNFKLFLLFESSELLLLLNKTFIVIGSHQLPKPLNRKLDNN
jgi:hypothetical protein